MGTIGASVSIRGEVRTSHDITIAGRVEGPVICEGVAVTLAATAEIAGDVFARDVTVFGRVSGRLIATDVVDLRPQCDVSGQVLSRRFILHEGAVFHGRVEPQHLEAALRVAKYQQRKEAETVAAAPAAAAAAVGQRL
jgi:cytoskeletal protein CcmA (bactofilin family)